MDQVAERLSKAFRKNLVYLKRSLDYSVIAGHVVQEDILQSDTREKIEALKTPSEQIERLLADVLPKRPPQAVVLLAQALIETDQTHHLTRIGIMKDDLDFIRTFKAAPEQGIYQGASLVPTSKPNESSYSRRDQNMAHVLQSKDERAREIAEKVREELEDDRERLTAGTGIEVTLRLQTLQKQWKIIEPTEFQEVVAQPTPSGKTDKLIDKMLGCSDGHVLLFVLALHKASKLHQLKTLTSEEKECIAKLDNKADIEWMKRS